MESDRIFLSWDDIGFPDFEDVTLKACSPEIAAHINDRTRLAASAYDNPGVLGGTGSALDTRILRVATQQIRAYVGRHSAAARRLLREVDGAHLLAAIAALSAFPSPTDRELIRAPGLYDRELEWLSVQPLTAGVRPPTWEEVLTILRTARHCLVAETFMPHSGESAASTLRERSVMASYLGATYTPIARELTERLTATAVQESKALGGSGLVEFPAQMDEVFDHFFTRFKALVLNTLDALQMAHDHPSVLKAVMANWSVSEITKALMLDSASTSKSCIREVTSQVGEGPIDLRSRPLLAVGDGVVLVLPRRLVCDRHEVLDLAVGRHIRAQGGRYGTYPDMRARMLDSVVAESLMRMLPGCRIYVGRKWTIDGVEQEKDVVALFDDIAVCVETKAPQLVPSRASSRRDVINVLRDVAHGVGQVSSVADALEAGTAIVDGLPLPRVRRAYRLVASLNTWWGTDLAVDLLQDAGVLPGRDAAILTCADSFVMYERLLRSAPHFIAYLDFRLAHQRRPWVRVSDETELIGGYFRNHDDRWTHRPPDRVVYLLKPVLQGTVDDAIRSSYGLAGPGARPLQHRHRPLVVANTKNWQQTRPRAWLQAFSALSRLATGTQDEIEWLLSERARPGRSNLRIRDAGRSARVVMVADPAAVEKRTWEHLKRNSPEGTPLLVVERATSHVLAVRGLDEDSFWVDQDWQRVLDGKGSDKPNKPLRNGQRPQPRRPRRSKQ